MRGKKLGEVRKKGLPDFDVVWGQGEKEFRTRLIAGWNRSKGQSRCPVTNLPRDRYTPEAVDQACRLRWYLITYKAQVNDFFQPVIPAKAGIQGLLIEVDSRFRGNDGFSTSNPGIAEGLIRAAIAAAPMKRYLARMAQVLRAVEVSTRKVAMCAHHVLTDLFRVLISRSHGELHETPRGAIEYLANNATRAHPKRERRTGRLQFGIVPILDVA